VTDRSDDRVGDKVGIRKLPGRGHVILVRRGGVDE